MNQKLLIFLFSAVVFEVVARGGDHGDHGGHDHRGHDHGDHDHHDHHHGGWGHDHDHGNSGGRGDGWGYRPFTGFGGRNYYGGGGGGLLGRLFGWRRRGYYGGNNGYSGYPNYGYGGFCRLSQFVDYVGQTPRFYCDCHPYPPNYQWNQCSPMYGG